MTSSTCELHTTSSQQVLGPFHPQTSHQCSHDQAPLQVLPSASSDAALSFSLRRRCATETRRTDSATRRCSMPEARANARSGNDWRSSITRLMPAITLPRDVLRICHSPDHLRYLCDPRASKVLSAHPALANEPLEAVQSSHPGRANASISAITVSAGRTIPLA